MSTWLTSWQANKHDTELQLMLTNNLKKNRCGWETTRVCPTNMFPVFPPCVSVIEGVWKSIPVSYWCVYVTRPSIRMANGFSSPQCLMRPDNRERQRLWEKTIYTTVHSFWFNQMMYADQQTGENVKVTVCVTVCMWGGMCVCLCVCVCTGLCELSMHPLSIASNMYYAHL